MNTKPNLNFIKHVFVLYTWMLLHFNIFSSTRLEESREDSRKKSWMNHWLSPNKTGKLSKKFWEKSPKQFWEESLMETQEIFLKKSRKKVFEKNQWIPMRIPVGIQEGIFAIFLTNSLKESRENLIDKVERRIYWGIRTRILAQEQSWVEYR